jgi:hypothetical protein
MAFLARDSCLASRDFALPPEDDAARENLRNDEVVTLDQLQRAASGRRTQQFVHSLRIRDGFVRVVDAVTDERWQSCNGSHDLRASARRNDGQRTHARRVRCGEAIGALAAATVANEVITR